MVIDFAIHVAREDLRVASQGSETASSTEFGSFYKAVKKFGVCLDKFDDDDIRNLAELAPLVVMKRDIDVSKRDKFRRSLGEAMGCGTSALKAKFMREIADPIYNTLEGKYYLYMTPIEVQNLPKDEKELARLVSVTLLVTRLLLDD